MVVVVLVLDCNRANLVSVRSIPVRFASLIHPLDHGPLHVLLVSCLLGPRPCCWSDKYTDSEAHHIRRV